MTIEHLEKAIEDLATRITAERDEGKVLALSNAITNLAHAGAALDYAKAKNQEQ